MEGRAKKTKEAVIWGSIFNEPLLTLYGLITFIMYKDLAATATQITVLIALKPLASILSMYWSAPVIHGKVKLKENVVWAGILSRIPFFFFPFIQNAWWMVLISALNMLFSRGAMPAWTEILKQNLPKEERERVFSQGAVWGYLEGVLLAAVVGKGLESGYENWRWMFPLSALIGMIGVYMQAKVPTHCDHIEEEIQEKKPLFTKIKDPWMAAWKLLQERPDFKHFQWGFMLCGLGLMIIQPALPMFFVDNLKLSYMDLALAISVFRGLAYAAASPLWAKWMSKVSIYNFCSVMFALVALFMVLLQFGAWGVWVVFLAYAVYGVVLAGNHLSWNLSGPIFAKHHNSSLYSTVNVMTVGVRGAIGPVLGGLLVSHAGPQAVLILGALLSIAAAWIMKRYRHP